MGILDFLRPPPQAHNEFGQLRFAGGRWRGTIGIANGARVPLYLPGSRTGPPPEALEVAEQASAWWMRARPEVERELYAHYSAGRDDDTAADMLDLHDADEVWAHCAISSVQIKPNRSLSEIQFAIRAAWDEEHTLGALIRDARLIELNGSILEPR